MRQRRQSIGIIGSHGSGTVQSIRRGIQDLGHRAEVIHPYDLEFEIRHGTPRLCHDVDALVNWQTMALRQDILEYLGALHAAEATVPVVNPATGSFLANHKPSSLHHTATVANVPDTYYSIYFNHVADESKKIGTAVQKPVFGGGGGGVERIDRDEIATTHAGPHAGFLQEYLDTPGDDHSDVRAFVVGDKVVAAMERTAPDDDWRTNISQGGDGTEIDLPDTAEEMAVQAVTETELDAVGVDLIQHTNGDWFVLELNAPAGFKGLRKATGINVGAYIAAHAIRKAGSDVPEDEVADVAAALEYSTDSPEQNSHNTEVCVVSTRDTAVLVGENDRTELETLVNFDMEKTAVDLETAGDVEVGSVKDTIENPVPGKDGTVPVVKVMFEKEDSVFAQNAALVDLSDLTVDCIFNSAIFNTANDPFPDITVEDIE